MGWRKNTFYTDEKCKFCLNGKLILKKDLGLYSCNQCNSIVIHENTTFIIPKDIVTDYDENNLKIEGKTIEINRRQRKIK